MQKHFLYKGKDTEFAHLIFYVLSRFTNDLM